MQIKKRSSKNVEQTLFFPYPERDVAQQDEDGYPDGGGDESQVHRRPRYVPSPQHDVPHGLRGRGGGG